MTFVELVIAVVVVVLFVSVLLGATRSVRRSAKRAQAVQLVAGLEKALSAYQAEHEVYPSGDEAGNAAGALHALLGDRGPLPEGVDPVLVIRDRGRRTVRDPWGTRLRYITDRYAAEPDRATINLTRPVFVSAGPDRDFGDDDPTHNSDNIASDDQAAPAAAASEK